MERKDGKKDGTSVGRVCTQRSKDRGFLRISQRNRDKGGESGERLCPQKKGGVSLGLLSATTERKIIRCQYRGEKGLHSKPREDKGGGGELRSRRPRLQ